MSVTQTDRQPPHAYVPPCEPKELTSFTMLCLNLWLTESEAFSRPPRAESSPAIHATRAGQCVIVAAERFWRWAYGLIEVEPPTQFSDRASFMDFDEAERTPAREHVGFSAIAVTGQDATGKPTGREATFTIDEFWDALVRLAKE
jgi:hypothetical protein